MVFKYPRYFLQTLDWAKYWKSANLPGHDYLEVSVAGNVDLIDKNTLKPLKIELDCAVIAYRYPWYFKQHFWYVPKLPLPEYSLNGQKIHLDDLFKLINTDQIPIIVEKSQSVFSGVMHELSLKAQESDSTFIKIDMDDNFSNLLGLDTNSQFLNLISKATDYQSFISSKVLQYLSCMVLEISVINPKQNSQDVNLGDYSNPTLQNFFESSRDFWLKTNENIRRYTKKSLSLNWRVSTEKSEANFEAFWEVYQSTSQRQSFFTHEKKVLQKLFQLESSRIIVLYDKDSKAQGSWMGLVSEDTLTYLYGGNTRAGLENYSQYLIHLVALKMTTASGLRFYDLGKYDESKSYSKFKQGYRGEVRNFLGPVDIVYKPVIFRFVNLAISIGKLIRNRS